MSTGWTRISHGTLCPICGHAGHCTIVPDRTAVRCTRDEGGKFLGEDSRGHKSWLHPLDPNSPKAMAVKTMKAADEQPQLTVPQLEHMGQQFKTALSQRRLDALSRALDVSNDALHAFQVGWYERCQAYTFPMRRGKDRIVTGFRTRTLDGSRKACVPGSKEGLFIPATFDVTPITTDDIADAIGFDACSSPVLLMPEGPTDAATAWDAGYRNAVGRPSNCGGVQHIRWLLSKHKTDVIIFSDHDKTKYRPSWQPYWPGIEGALSVATQTVQHCRRLYLVEAERMPNDIPADRGTFEGPDGKIDLRSWVKEHGKEAFPAAIAQTARLMNPEILRVLNVELEDRRKAEWDRKRKEMAPPEPTPAMVEQIEWSRRTPLAMVA